MDNEEEFTDAGVTLGDDTEDEEEDADNLSDLGFHEVDEHGAEIEPESDF